MIKKLFSGSVLALALVLSLAGTAVFAEEDTGIMPINETGENTPVDNDSEADTQDSDGTPVRDHDYPGSDATADETAGEISEPTDDATTDETIDLEAGTATPEDEDSDEETAAGEAETWPMYVSLGALGAAVLVFIILNLFGKKKR